MNLTSILLKRKVRMTESVFFPIISLNTDSVFIAGHSMLCLTHLSQTNLRIKLLFVRFLQEPCSSNHKPVSAVWVSTEQCSTCLVWMGCSGLNLGDQNHLAVSFWRSSPLSPHCLKGKLTAGQKTEHENKNLETFFLFKYKYICDLLNQD